MPSALAMTRSSGVVMNPRTRSAFAPTYTVEIRTTAMSLRGYCRTLRARIDCRPAIRMTRLTTIARTGRLTNRSVRRILTILRLRSRFVTWLNLIVDENGRTVAKLEHTRTDGLFARLEAGQDRDLIAARGTELDKLLAHAAIGLTIRVLEVCDNEHRIAVRRVADRRRRQGYNRAARA